MFGEFDFNRMNETDVRENVVAPLLRELGYRHSSENDIITEQTLRYPKAFVGRKNTKKDPVLRGKADYLLEVEKRLRWVIEVKAPDGELGIDEIEQAYTYAAHPEVRAIFFALTNGLELRLFLTQHGPEAPEVFRASYENLENEFQSLENILSPASLKRDFPDFVLDVGKPLASGLRSFAKILHGKITYTDNSLNNVQFKGMNFFVSEGFVQRSATGGLLAYIKPESPFQQLQEINKLLGLEVFEVFSDEEAISSNPEESTVFTSDLDYTIPRGTPLYDFTKGTSSISPIDIPVQTRTVAHGCLRNGNFTGTFEVFFRMSILLTPMNMSGTFEMKLG